MFCVPSAKRPMRLYPNHFARAICCDSSRTPWQRGRPRSNQGIAGRMNWVVLRFPCDIKTAARAEKVLEQLNKGLPPEVREPGTPENSMQPMPDVTPAKSKIQHRTAKRIVHEPLTCSGISRFVDQIPLICFHQKPL